MQHRPEAELLGEAQNGQDIVVAVCVMVDHTGPVQDLQQSFHPQVACGSLILTLCLLGATPVVLRLEKLLPHQRRRPGSCTRKRRRTTRVRPVGHLHAARDLSVRAIDSELIDCRAVPKFQIDGLTAQQMTRARHHVRGRDPPGLRFLQPRVTNVDRVEDTNIRMEGAAVVASLWAPDMAVRINETRHDRLAVNRGDAPRWGGIVVFDAGPTATIRPW